MRMKATGMAGGRRGGDGGAAPRRDRRRQHHALSCLRPAQPAGARGCTCARAAAAREAVAARKCGPVGAQRAAFAWRSVRRARLETGRRALLSSLCSQLRLAARRGRQALSAADGTRILIQHNARRRWRGMACSVMVRRGLAMVLRAVLRRCAASWPVAQHRRRGACARRGVSVAVASVALCGLCRLRPLHLHRRCPLALPSSSQHSRTRALAPVAPSRPLPVALRAMSSPPSAPPDPFVHSASGAASPAHSDAGSASAAPASSSDKPVPPLPPAGTASPRADDAGEDAAVQWGGSAYEVPPSLRPDPAAAGARSDDEGFEHLSDPPAWSSGAAADDEAAAPALAGSSASLPRAASPDPQRRKSARVSKVASADAAAADTPRHASPRCRRARTATSALSTRSSRPTAGRRRSSCTTFRCRRSGYPRSGATPSSRRCARR